MKPHQPGATRPRKQAAPCQQIGITMAMITPPMEHLKHLCFTLLVLCCVLSAQAQPSPPADSLRQRYQNTELPDTARFAAAADAFGYWLQVDRDSASALLPHMRQLARAVDLPRSSYRALLLECRFYTLGSMYHEGDSLAEEMLAITRTHNMPLEESRTLFQMATLARGRGDTPAAIEHLKACATVARPLANNDPEARLALLDCYANLGGLLFNIYEYEASLEYAERTLAMDSTNVRARSLAIYNYMALQRVNEALAEVQRLEQTDWSEVSSSYLTFLAVAGDVYQASGDLEAAMDCAQRGIALARQIGLADHLVSLHYSLAMLNTDLARWPAAVAHADSCAQYAEGLGSIEMHIMVAEASVAAHEGAGNLRQAMDWSRILFSLRDSMLNESQTANIARLETEFRYEQEILADSLANAQAMALAAAEQARIDARNQWAIGSLLTGLLVVIAILAFAINRARVIRQQKATIEEQKAHIQRDFLQLKDFTENAAHEMQTPMAVIRSKLEALLQSPDFTEEQVHNIMAVYGASGRLTHLNKSLLLLARIENKQYEVHETVDYSKVVNQHLDWFHELMEHQELQVTAAVEKSLLLPSNPILADTMVSNLLKNAIRHNVEGSTIVVELNQQNLCISNTGKPIDFDPNTLFERFQKADASAEGTGLGLAIVKEAAEAHGWTVEYQHHDGVHTLRIVFEKAAA